MTGSFFDYSVNPKKHDIVFKNSSPTPKKTQLVSVAKINWLCGLEK
jgi:hypothetical protein